MGGGGSGGTRDLSPPATLQTYVLQRPTLMSHHNTCGRRHANTSAPRHDLETYFSKYHKGHKIEHGKKLLQATNPRECNFLFKNKSGGRGGGGTRDLSTPTSLQTYVLQRPTLMSHYNTCGMRHANTSAPRHDLEMHSSQYQKATKPSMTKLLQATYPREWRFF